jgi:hypothetical protein
MDRIVVLLLFNECLDADIHQVVVGARQFLREFLLSISFY